MSDKVSWKTIVDDFKKRHPTLAKQVGWWCPHDYAEVCIQLKDGMSIIYNYDDKKAFIKDGGS